jgi:hypothetical protein
MPPFVELYDRLPESVSAHILSFLGAREVEQVAALISKVFLDHARSPELWYMLCFDTGKTSEIIRERPQSPLLYRKYYQANPHVPLDCATLAAALDRVPSSGTIVIRGGTILLENNLTVTSDCCIAVFPPSETASVVTRVHSAAGRNKPLLTINENVTLTVSNVSFMHFSQGEDIWNGNCGVFVTNGNLFLNSCSVQSSTGRGIVSVKGGVIKAQGCVIHDSAATGVYAGGSSVCTLDECNIVRNGVGGREIPSGHSGVYIEASKAVINDCFVSANSLTGITLVRGGNAVISFCDCVENGSEAFTIEDETTMNSTVAFNDNNFDGVGEKSGEKSAGRRAGLMDRFSADSTGWRIDLETGGGRADSSGLEDDHGVSGSDN